VFPPWRDKHNIPVIIDLLRKAEGREEAQAIKDPDSDAAIIRDEAREGGTLREVGGDPVH
jgi:hypothetical protein